MGPGRTPVLRLCLGVIDLASRLVPAPQRQGWRQEWEAELLHRWDWMETQRRLGPREQADLLRRVMGALPDAAWLRRQLTLDADAVHDVRHGLRLLRREAGFAGTAVAVLALGLASTTAIFTLVDTLLLRRVPYPDPDRIVMVWQSNPRARLEKDEVAPANFLDWRERSRSFEVLTAAIPFSYDYTGGDVPEVFFAAQVTEDFFRALGVRPALGRAFLREEHQKGREKVAVISDGLWRRRFAADPSLVGRTIPLENEAYTVVGVLPAEFDPGLLPTSGIRELWTPHVKAEHETLVRGTGWWSVVGRLRPDVSLAQAQEEMRTVAAVMASEHPRTNSNVTATLQPFRDHLTAGVRPALHLLAGAVGLVLLIAWANVAGLLLARGTRREREMAVRASLGAGRGRLVRQLLAENALIAILGCAVGLALASWGVGAIVALSPINVPRLHQVQLDGRVFGFAALITVLTTLGCGMLPALRLSRPRLGKSLREGTRTAVAGRQRVREALVVGERALALVLLLGAGLLTRSFARLLQVDPGFRAPGLAVLQVFFGDRQTTREKRAEFFQQTVAKLRTLPGVVAAGAVSRMPFIEANITIRSPFLIEGRPHPPGQEPSTVLSVATPGYLDAMRIPLREGRWFEERDAAGTTPVAVVNDVAARQYWPGESPLGRRVALRFEGRPLQAEIVGVVGAVRHERLDRPASAEAFVPHAQVPSAAMTYVLRTDGDPRWLIAAARERVWSVDPMQSFYRTATVSELVAKSVADRRFLMVLLSVFAALALLLAATGIYGLLSFVVAQRTQEIGVRRALGAGQAAILRLVLGQGMKLVLGGLAIGLAGFLALRGVLRGLLFDVSSVDPVAVASVLALLLAVALAACYLPARRAMVVDPAAALRSE